MDKAWIEPVDEACTCGGSAWKRLWMAWRERGIGVEGPWKPEINFDPRGILTEEGVEKAWIGHGIHVEGPWAPWTDYDPWV